MAEETKVQTAPHQDLVPDPNGGWTMRKIIRPLPPALDTVERVFKIHSPTRVCPIHGEVNVLDKTFNKSLFSGTEGLSCGHTLLVYRLTRGLKKVKIYFHNDPRNCKFGGWALVFKQTR
jgi:hypothetical protein